MRTSIHRALALLTTLGSSACAEVRVEEAPEEVATTVVGATSTTAGVGASGSSSSIASAGSGGAGSATTAAGAGGDGSGGALEGGGGSGAGGEGGGPARARAVPGCEVLAWVGEPLVLATHLQSMPRLQRLGNGDVGLVHADRGAPERILATVLPAPFEVWPPTPGAAILVGETATTNMELRLDGREDGTFSVADHWPSIAGRFEEGALGLTFDGWLVVDPSPAGGGYGIARLGDEVVRFDTLEAGALPTSLGLRPSARCYRASAFVAADGSLFSSDGPARYCDAVPTVEIMRATPDGIEKLASHPVEGAWSHEILPRSGGAWLVTSDRDQLDVLPLDERGAVAGPAWSEPTFQGFARVAPWRGGFTVAEFTNGEVEDGVGLRVSDGVNTTTLEPRGENWAGQSVPSVVASADGRSLLIAHEFLQNVFVSRADCASR